MCKMCETIKARRDLRAKLNKDVTVTMSEFEWMTILTMFSVSRNLAAAIISNDDDMTVDLVNQVTSSWQLMAGPEESVAMVQKLAQQVKTPAVDSEMISIDEIPLNEGVDLPTAIQQAHEVKQIKEMYGNGPSQHEDAADHRQPEEEAGGTERVHPSGLQVVHPREQEPPSAEGERS